jgi:uncharacterized protein (TIGR02001 family)
MINRGLVGLAVASATVLASSAMAYAEDAESMFDVAFGAAVASDYIFRGITQTDHKAAIQGYIEPSAGIFYGGLWASNVSFVGDTDTEVDFYAGVRPEVGPFSLDFGYNYATYTNDPDSNAGELYAKADISASDNATIGAQFFLNPDDSSTYIEANADITLPHNFGISGAVGAVSNDTMPYATWNAGIYYTPFDWAKIDLRYSATNLSTSDCATASDGAGTECDGRLMLSLSIDTSLSALKAK